MTNDTSDSQHGSYNRKVCLKELHITGGVTDDTSDSQYCGYNRKSA